MFQNLHFAVRKIGAGLGMLTIAVSSLYAQKWEDVAGVSGISAGESSYNNPAVDKVNNNLMLAYSENNVTKVKRIVLKDTSNVPDCTNTDPGSNAGDTGCVSFKYQGQQVSYSTVRGNDGNIWMQQNLGSVQVASAISDELSYGDLFQWGRWDDGHQFRNSATVSAPSSNTPDGLGTNTGFITGTPGWWGAFAATDQWTASNPLNVSNNTGADPCKVAGQEWKMPSQAEWAAIVTAENIANPGTAYSSHLKLPASGYRSSSNGALTFVGQRGYFWSSDTSNSGGKYLYVGSSIANPSSGAMRGQGSAVRCIKTGSALGTSDIIKTKEIIGIYPNPTNGILHIKADELIENVHITNWVGQRLNVEFSNNQINMIGLPNGAYIVELKLKNGQIFSKKIIKN